MDTTWKVTAADRDEAGKIKVEAPQEPRSLADLLPKPEEIKADAAKRAPHKFTRVEAASIAVVMLLAAFVFVWTARTGSEPVVSPLPTAAILPTAIPTVMSTARPTALPIPEAAPIAAYWAPGGEHAPDMESASQPIARYGETWVQVQDGRWIAAGDAGLGQAALMQLPDRAPPPTPVIERVIVQQPEIAAPTPAPPPEPVEGPTPDPSHGSKIDTRSHGGHGTKAVP